MRRGRELLTSVVAVCALGLMAAAVAEAKRNVYVVPPSPPPPPPVAQPLCAGLVAPTPALPSHS